MSTTHYAPPMRLGVFPETWLALLAPRRLLPILVVCVPLVAAQVWFTRIDPLLVGLSALMCLGFVLLAPGLWRALFPGGARVPFGAARLAAFVGLGGLFVVGFGWALPFVLGMPSSFLTSLPSVFIASALFWVGGWGLGRDIDLEQGLVAERARAALLEKEAERSRLMALRSHLDPHFLFNTLNAIAEWCREDGEVAERAVLKLSSMLRTILEGVRVPAWSLAQELALLDDLLALHLLRDPELFVLSREVTGPVEDARVPPMVLLPLVENAVKHGPAAGHRGVLRLSVARGGARVRVEVENPGPFLGPREGGEGLSMVERRLALAYEGEARFEISGTDQGRTRAVVEMPATGPREGRST